MKISSTCSNKIGTYKSTNSKNFVIVGTPDYMSPEALKGEKVTFVSDFWALGVVLYELITDFPPFNAKSVYEVFDNIINCRLNWLPIQSNHDDENGISRELDDLLRKLLVVDLDKRLGARGVQELKMHPFFEGVDWSDLSKMKPTFIPAKFKAPLTTDQDELINRLMSDFGLNEPKLETAPLVNNPKVA